jgi:hypothetical protein
LKSRDLRISLFSNQLWVLRILTYGYQLLKIKND